MAESKKPEKVVDPESLTNTQKIRMLEVKVLTGFTENFPMPAVRKDFIDTLNNLTREMTPDERKEFRQQLKERLERLKLYSEAIFNEMMASTSGW